MFASRDVCIHSGKKTWSGLRCTPLLILPIQGVYKTFKHGMFRVGGSCNFPILCAHFLYDNKWQILSRGTINIPTLTLCFKWTIQNVYMAITYICTYSFIFLVLYFSCILLFSNIRWYNHCTQLYEEKTVFSDSH